MRSPLWLVLLAPLCGALFFWRAPALWPQAAPLPPIAAQETAARRILESVGVATRGLSAAFERIPDEASLDYLDKTIGREKTRQALASGAPLLRTAFEFSQAGDAHRHTVHLLPGGRLAMLARGIEDDDSLPPDVPVAEPQARAALGGLLGEDFSGWRLISESRREQPNRIERSFVYERPLPAAPQVRERAAIRYAGKEIAWVVRNVVLPPAALRDARRAGAASQVLETVGLLLFGAAVLCAGAIFLLRLRAGNARLRGPAILAGGSFLLLLAHHGLLRPPGSDPLIPDALEITRRLIGVVAEYAWTFALLFAVISAGDALDREGRAGAGGASLWALASGRWRDRAVAAASRNGLLIGLLCGGLMAALIWLLELFGTARVALQPRAFAATMQSALFPPLATLTYFCQIALLEELGYRYFAGTWLDRLTKRRWVAVFLPALVYGLTHTSLGFLPPAEPFWARAAVMCAIGCVWGWAYFRFDALTVVFSHLFADLFIFNWSGIWRGDIGSLAALALPLLPALPGRVSRPSSPPPGN